MNGRRLVQGFLVFLAIFAGALIYTQFFAYYERRDDVATIRVGGADVPVAGYDGIDSRSSPLKLRGCFEIDPAAVARCAGDRRDAPDAAVLVSLLRHRSAVGRHCFGRGAGLCAEPRRAEGLRRDARGLSRRARLPLAPAERRLPGPVTP